jgi:hypothetical protein
MAAEMVICGTHRVQNEVCTLSLLSIWDLPLQYSVKFLYIGKEG